MMWLVRWSKIWSVYVVLLELKSFTEFIVRKWFVTQIIMVVTL